MKENLIIIHGGGPTAVLNCSLYGAVREAQASGLVEHVYGAVGGTGGLLKEKLLDFGSVPEGELERLPTTPATAIGTWSWERRTRRRLPPAWACRRRSPCCCST